MDTKNVEEYMFTLKAFELMMLWNSKWMYGLFVESNAIFK